MEIGFTGITKEPKIRGIKHAGTLPLMADIMARTLLFPLTILGLVHYPKIMDISAKNRSENPCKPTRYPEAIANEKIEKYIAYRAYTYLLR